MGVLALLVFTGAMCEQAEEQADENVNEVNINEEVEAAGFSESKVADLYEVGEVPGSGVAIRGLLKDTDQFELSVGADLPDPAKENFYEAWLKKGGDEFSVGSLEKIQGTWVVNYENDVDYSDYAEIVVTKETTENGEDGIPEEPVLEGEFTGEDEDKKMTICHKPGTPAEQTMEIDQSAWPAHQAQGAYIGPCED